MSNDPNSPPFRQGIVLWQSQYSFTRFLGPTLTEIWNFTFNASQFDDNQQGSGAEFEWILDITDSVELQLKLGATVLWRDTLPDPTVPSRLIIRGSILSKGNGQRLVGTVTLDKLTAATTGTGDLAGAVTEVWAIGGTASLNDEEEHDMTWWVACPNGAPTQQIGYHSMRIIQR